jgi:N-methylhydantoinase A
LTDGRRYRIGLDIGGTFTDVVMFDAETQELRLAKATTTPADRAIGFMAGLEKVAADIDARDVQSIFHGSTVATNAVLELNGSRMGLLTTLGFRDILEIGRAYIPGIFTNHLRWQKPPRLVPLELVREVPERLAPDGSVVRPFIESKAREAIAELNAQGVESIAICLLHSYANPAHEERLEALINEIAPHVFVSRSSAVLPEYREYERAITTVLNAYVMPVVARYLGGLQDRLRDRGFPTDLRIVRSDAGVMSLAAAVAHPVNTVLSGPAGGVKGASAVAAAAGYPNVVSLDMGGTSTDVCLSSSGEPRLSTDAWIAHYPVRVPMVDITTIGAGGGSLANVSVSGALRVGPRSAGAVPGPACYGRGGELPTVTDANLVLGRLPEKLAGGELTLNVDAAREAVMKHVACPLGLSLEEAAAGMIRIVDEAMLGALRVVSVQRGVDPRELALVPFGGAGPVHGANLARLAGINTMLVPTLPGVLSALGFLLADVKNVLTLTRVGVVGRLDIESYNADLQNLVAQADAWLAGEGLARAERSIEVALDLRYQGQAYEIPISATAALDADGWRAAVARFHAEHARRYGFDQPKAIVEVVTLRVSAVGALPKPAFPKLPEVGPESGHARIDERPVYFDGCHHAAGFYDRALLLPGNQVAGPAVIVQPDCTTVLGPGQSLRVDALGNLIVNVGAAA